MSLKLNSSGGGSVLLQEPVTASDLTLNLPATLGGTGNSMAVTSDASGNVGIGTNSPSFKLSVASSTNNDGVQVLNTSTANSTEKTTRIGFYGTDTVGTVKEAGSVYTVPTDVNYVNSAMLFFTRGSDAVGERMRIDSSGNLLVGTTSSVGTKVYVRTSAQDAVYLWADGAASNLTCRKNNTNGGFVLFDYNGTGVGSITTNSTSTTYNTSSDYRLKEDVAPMTGALAKVTALKPVTYKWKATGGEADGFIAHELAEVCPQAVTGEKDAVDADGTPKYQGIDTSFLVATLTSAIQELKAELDTVKAELAAMKGTA